MAAVGITDGAATTCGSGGGGGGAPIVAGAPANAQFWVGASSADLTAEHNLSGFTGLVLNTAGTPSAAVAGTHYVSPAGLTTALAPYALAATTVTAGAGLTGSGTLGANLTLAVAAGDGTITVNADSIQVGEIANANVAAAAAIAHSKLANLTGLSVLGRSASGSGALAAITAATTGHALRYDGSAIGFGTLAAGAFAGTQTNGFVLSLSGGVPTWQAAAGGVTDHGALTGLSDDDHSIYALLAGRSGGQTLIGGTASGNSLLLQSTSHGTKGTVALGSATTGVVYDEVNNRFGYGTNSFTSSITGTLPFVFQNGSMRVGLNGFGTTTGWLEISNGTLHGFLGHTGTGGLITGTYTAHGYIVRTGNENRLFLSSTGNMAFTGAVGGSADFTGYGGGVGVLYIAGATTAPTTNPTGGALLYGAGSVLTIRDNVGNVVTLN